MRICWLGLVVLVLPATAVAELVCDKAELKDPSCTTLSVNYTPLYFSASCAMECTGKGSDRNCSPVGEKVTPQTLSLETVVGNQPIAGTFSQQGTCDFQVPLWKFSGALTKGVAYNVVHTYSGERRALLTFTAGSSNPGVDSSVPPPPGDGGSSTTDSGGTVPGTDGGSSSSGDGGTNGGTNGSGEDGCSCRLSAGPDPAPWLLVGFFLPLFLRRRRV